MPIGYLQSPRQLRNGYLIAMVGIYAIIHIKYVSPKLYHLPQFAYGFRDPIYGTWFTSYLDGGNRSHTHTGAGDIAWVSNYIRYIVCDEITASFQNFNGATVEVWDGFVIATHTLVGIWLPNQAGVNVNPH